MPSPNRPTYLCLPLPSSSSFLLLHTKCLPSPQQRYVIPTSSCLLKDHGLDFLSNHLHPWPPLEWTLHGSVTWWGGDSVVSNSCDPMDCSPPGSSAHGILQAKILEWVAVSFSRGSSWPRDQTPVSCIASEFFTSEPPGMPISVKCVLT